MKGKAYVQVYTGNGKGKTTAAFGLALRAVCAGKKVYIGQFVKGMDYSELKAPEYLPGLEIEQFGQNRFIFGEPSETDIEMAVAAIEKCEKITASGDYDIVILDELNIALYYKLFTAERVIKMLDEKAEHTEIIITGRNAPEELIERADLVTEMREIKHYYNTQGVVARTGIEK